MAETETAVDTKMVRFFAFVPFMVLTVQMKPEELQLVTDEEEMELKKVSLQSEIGRAIEQKRPAVYNINFGDRSKPFRGYVPERLVERLKKRPGYGTEFISQTDFEKLLANQPMVFQQWTTTMQTHGKHAGLDEKTMIQLPMELMAELQKDKLEGSLRLEIEAKVRAEMAGLKNKEGPKR